MLLNFFRNFGPLFPFHLVNKVMKTETIVLNLAALRGGMAATHLSPGAFDGTSTVSNLVVEAVEETCRRNPARLILPRTAGNVSAPWLLRVLTCSYAKGVLGSEDIERKLHAESPPGEPVPDFHTLRRFRRLNRAVVEAALERALRLMRLRQVRAAQPVAATAVGLGAETAVILHHEATARIEEAILLDHAAVDG